MLACRPANQPTAIHPSLQIGIPSFISDKEDQFQLYFVTVQPIAQVTTAPAKLQVGHQQPLHLDRMIAFIPTWLPVTPVS